MQAHDFVRKVKDGEIDPVENIFKVLEKIEKINDEYHFFTTICRERAISDARRAKDDTNGILSGLPISIKDCICVKGVESTAASRILSGYKPVFDATAVSKINSNGGIIIGKTVQDEFGFGGFSTNVGIGHKAPLNPFDKERSCGGSSGGSGGITLAADFPHISIAESTGGSIVNPAAFCSVVGLCPTYGRVSRYGLIDYGNSLDKIGTMGKTVADAALGLQAIAGHDEKDSTSQNKPVPNYIEALEKDIKGIRIGVVKESFTDAVTEDVSDGVWKGIKALESAGAEYEEMSLPITMRYAPMTYYLLSAAEASTNLARYCGMRYGASEELKGNFNEYFSEVRSRHFGTEAKRRIMLGTFARMAGYRDAYYIRAAKVRTKIIEEYQKRFKRFDALVTPTVPTLPMRFSDIDKMSLLQTYMFDILTVGPNLAGLPHISMPAAKKEGLPIGMKISANHLEEGKLLCISRALERELDGT